MHKNFETTSPRVPVTPSSPTGRQLSPRPRAATLSRPELRRIVVELIG